MLWLFLPRGVGPAGGMRRRVLFLGRAECLRDVRRETGVGEWEWAGERGVNRSHGPVRATVGRVQAARAGAGGRRDEEGD